MHSWKYKKLRDEKRKAKRIIKSRAIKAYALHRRDMSLPIQKSHLQLSYRQRLMDKLKSISFRNIFKRK